MGRRHWVGAVLAGVLAVAGGGCTPSALWFLLKGDGKQPAKYPLPPKDGKKEVTVAILTTGSPALGMDPQFAGADREMVATIAKRLVEETKGASHPIKVVDPAKVERLKAAPGSDWRTKNPGAIGKELGADYVLDVTVTSMSMYSKEFAGELFQGKASVQVVVYDTDKLDATPQKYVHNSTTPEKSATAVTPDFYRNMFVERVASEIAYQHVPHTSEGESAPIR